MKKHNKALKEIARKASEDYDLKEKDKYTLEKDPEPEPEPQPEEGEQQKTSLTNLSGIPKVSDSQIKKKGKKVDEDEEFEKHDVTEKFAGYNFGTADNTEVLPYESLFDWIPNVHPQIHFFQELTESLGFYKEMDKYLELQWLEASRKLLQIEQNRIIPKNISDPENLEAVETMWKDWKEYQALKRYVRWPPKTWHGIFFSWGYYEDTRSRPTINLVGLASEAIQAEEQKVFKSPERLQTFVNLVSNFWRSEWEKPGEDAKKHETLPDCVVANPKAHFDEFDPEKYNKLKLRIYSLPKDTTQTVLHDLFPKATSIEMIQLRKGNSGAELTFETIDDARRAYRRSRLKFLSKCPIVMLPTKLVDNVEFLNVPDVPDPDHNFWRDPWGKSDEVVKFTPKEEVPEKEVPAETPEPPAPTPAPAPAKGKKK